MYRRDFIKCISGIFAFILVSPMNALAGAWNKVAFEAYKLDEAEKILEIKGGIQSHEILITVPDKAENGAIVQVEVKSNIPNTETISIFVEKNPTPLIANFKFSNGAEPFVVTRIKMAETSDVKVIVKAGNLYFINSKNVVVLENGCG
jgi:sulfur-oxidizing protein SoxY